MKKSILYLLSLLLMAFLIIVILVYTAPDPNKQHNGFQRLYLQTDPLKPYAAIPTNDQVLDIAGANNELFFFSTKDPAIMLAAPMEPGAHLDTFPVRLRQSVKDSMDTYFFTEANNSDLYVYGYNIPAIYRTDSMGTTIKLSAGGFSQARVTRDGRYVMLRKLNIQEKDQLFVRVSLNGDSILTEHGLSILHRDGGMSTDGSLNYDRTTGLFTYLYYYSNNYITFDSALNLISTGHSIDTFSVSRFNVATTMAKDQHVYMNQGPDQMVNGFSCVNNGVLFVQAKLKADNDDNSFREYPVIDQYDLKTNRYKGSIRLAIPARTKINQLFAHGNNLLVHGSDSVYCVKITY